MKEINDKEVQQVSGGCLKELLSGDMIGVFVNGLFDSIGRLFKRK